ncbi:AAA family ATPase [Yersinia ruckeri]|nr:AAA family ATPase [Yersinia ruckeri]
MIRSIKKLCSFGIYEDHNNSNCDDFSNLNLIYGWNGSGKSTLSKLFRCIEKKDISSSGHETTDFEIEYSDCVGGVKSVLTQRDIHQSNINIRVFNQEFISENIDWNNIINSVLLIDKERIKDKNELENKRSEVKGKTEIAISTQKEIDSSKEEINKFLTDTARLIKTNFQVIDTLDSYYVNYNRTKLYELIQRRNDSLTDESALLSDEALLEFTKAAMPIEKPTIAKKLSYIEVGQINDRYRKLDEILKKSVASKTIQALKDNPSLQSWVELGLKIHSDRRDTYCNFCGGGLDKDRLLELENHFSDEFKKFKTEIANSFGLCTAFGRLELPSKEDLFNEFAMKYSELCSSIQTMRDNIDIIFEEWRGALERKNDNPFELYITASSVNESYIYDYNLLVDEFNLLVDKHNSKSTNFKNEINKIRDKLEMHYASQEVIKFKYFEKQEKNKENGVAISQLNSKVIELNNKVSELEVSLSDESIAADTFNDELHKFLGRSEICLHYDVSKGGYRIIRNGAKDNAKNLSEGEKTAIAFVYFAIKSGESGNDIKKTIIVIDDPVSSFDSNHLFHSYAFLKKNFETAKQLFVLTHNFSYFKLMRDWILKKNKKGKKDCPDVVKSKIYTIESMYNGVRCSKLVNASNNLVDYDSEYHYLYSKLSIFKQKTSLDLDDVYLCANLSRRLLETFLSFKFPKKRNDFKELVDYSVKGIDTISNDEVERVYRFINKYSHNQAIDMGDSADNLLGESPAIINSLFNMIEKIDKIHYQEMESLVNI